MPLPRFIANLSTRLSSQFRWQTFAALVTGTLLVLSFQPFNYSLLAWIALAPLLYVLAGGTGWRRALWLGWLAGWLFFFFATNWITHSMIQYGGMPASAAYGVAALFAAIPALFPALFAVMVTQLVRTFGDRALLLAPFVWAASEWLRGIITGVTWNALGITQVDSFALAGLSRHGGVSLVSVVVMFAGSLLVLWYRQVSHPERFVFQLLLLCVFIAPFILTTMGMSVRMIYLKAAGLHSPDKPGTGVSIAVAAVQPNIPLSIYETPDEAARYFAETLKLTREAVNQSKNQKPELLVWAESPLILNYENDPNVRAQLDKLVQETGSYLIFSALARADNQYFNSAQTLAPPAAQQSVRPLKRYDKIRLVPFGEYVPFRSLLGYFVPALVGDFTPGREAVVNSLRLRTQLAVVQNDRETEGQPALERTTNFVRTGTFICYEAAYPDIVRQFARNGATLLVNISNDAWFGNTAGARQHLAQARMRAIENDRDLVRVTNSGVSALIKSDGRVIDEMPRFTAQAKIWQAETNNRQTFYTRHGDWFAIGCTIISTVALVISLIRQRSNHRVDEADAVRH